MTVSHNQVEEQLRQREVELAEAQRLAHVGSWTWDVRGDTVTWSDELYRIFGLHPQEFPATYEAFLACIHPDDREATRSIVETSLRTGKPYLDRRRIVRPDGEIRVVEAHGSVVFDEHGAPIHMFGTSQDITDRERVEAALREAQQRYRDILDNLHEGVFQTTPEGTFITANRALVQMLGFASEHELIETRRDIAQQHYVNPADRDEFKRRIDLVGKVTGFEFECYCKDGRRIWLSENGRVVRANDGHVLYYEGTARDITDRKQAESALRESEERYRELFENSRDAVYVHDMSGRYTSVNHAAEELTGYAREEIIGKHYSNFIAPNYLREARESFCRKLDLPIETTYEAEVICKDGTRKPVEVSSRMIHRNGAPIGVQGTVRDVTERKRAQRTLQTYSRRLIQAQEAERESIARELHDQIGQALTAINMNLQWIRRSGAVLPAGQPRIKESIEVIDETLQRVRELSLELRPSLLDDLGLAAALRWYATRFSARTGILTEVTGDLQNDGIHRAVQTACFRIVQEALTNAARHSRAKRALVTLEERDQRLQLGISDDGVGFDAQLIINSSSSFALGLRGMQERALAVNGQLHIDSKVGGGTRIVVVVPLMDSANITATTASNLS
ncbi:MAG TPA: PAS domain S-box protein [Pyrinomonadaceae bacterium]|nr:PAS domain S-box protein [Pyrinomonadaceae bacterium]